jgi:hypothetical protein
MESRIAELTAAPEVARVFTHADESVTVIMYDHDAEHANPRDNDGNVATLVSESRDFTALDSDNFGISEARSHFDGPNRAAMVTRYVAMHCPDIAHYVDEWSVTGNSQGDYMHGYGFVTREALAEAGYSEDSERLSGTLRMRAATLFDAELEVFSQYFRGEVYGAVHVTKGAPVTVECIAHRGDSDETLRTESGHDYTDESVWGFLGYESLEDIAAELTESPITDTDWR